MICHPEAWRCSKPPLIQQIEDSTLTRARVFASWVSQDMLLHLAIFRCGPNIAGKYEALVELIGGARCPAACQPRAILSSTHCTHSCRCQRPRLATPL